MTPFDPGLQPERTAMAWRRSALMLSVGSLAAGRVLEPVLGAVSWLLAVIGVVLGLGLLFAARRRSVTVGRTLQVHRDLTAGPGARLLASLAVVAVLIGIVGLLVVVGHAAIGR